MKRGSALGLLVVCAAWGQPIPPEKGSGPDWDSGIPIQSAFGRCRNCHDQAGTLEPLPAALHMPFDGWVSSMMGNAQRDPLYRAAVTVANQDVKDIGAWCLRCHSPQAYLNGHVLPADAGAFDAIDFEGVTCDVCHRSFINTAQPGAPFVGNAQIYFDLSYAKFGPYPDQMNAGHNAVQSTFTGSSELCGQCHSVHNPVGPWRALDGGTLGAQFPLDTTYEEWKQSDFARLGKDAGFFSCADCHLPRFTGPDGGTSYKIAKMGDFHEKPPQHVLAGGNVWGLDAVQAANPDLAIEFSDQFALTKKFTLQNLKSAASLKLTVPVEDTSNGVAHLTVRVTNRTGHKLPTGYADGRRLVVQVQVDDTIVSGRFDGGSLLPDYQLRVYEAQHGRAGIGVGEHLALHDAVFLDSRIPPRGFVATAQTRAVGVTWFDLPDGGFRDFDEATYDLSLAPTDAGTARVTVRLLFQSTTPEYINFLATENRTDDAGQQLRAIYNATGKGAPIEIASAEATLVGPTLPGGSFEGRPCRCATSPGFGALALLAFAAARKLRSNGSSRRARRLLEERG